MKVINYKCYKFVTFRRIITMGAAIFFSCTFKFERCDPSSAGMPREVAIDLYSSRIDSLEVFY